MAKYDDLTDEQKADIAAYDKFLRGVASSMVALRKQVDVDSWSQFAKDNVESTIAGLDADEVIPNSTNLARAKDLTVKELAALQVLLRQFVGAYAQNTSLLVKAIGINA